jgi:aminopeptidase N
LSIVWFETTLLTALFFGLFIHKSMKFNFLPLILGATLLISATGCGIFGKSQKVNDLDDILANMAVVDSMAVTEDYDLEYDEERLSLGDIEDNPYRPSYKRTNDLIHQDIAVRFDWDQRRVLGVTKLTLKPLFYATDKLQLDAKYMIVNSIVNEKGVPLKYEYIDNNTMTITLDRVYTRDESYSISIDYIGQPEVGEAGGSAAITSEKGLFFINHDGKDPVLPRQIWTQGETENNSRWFPTIDKPNERATFNVTLTIPDSMVSLSNGLMTKSTKNADGSRTDVWTMDKPHAPYLVMLAAGQFAVVSDKWNNIAVDYYVDPEYKADAREIFPHTPELLQFFSDRLGVVYPWQKYSQMIAHEYVSGAMENTTAVIFGDFVQKHKEDLVDVKTNDMIVAHEMFHHWFGDLVTCEDWSNLTLNEGFANYSEYLWMEHKYGVDAAEAHRYEELGGYLDQAASGGAHPLVDFHFEDKEAMFDAHSYNKGGLVLHMLRNYVGDDAFFAALKYYLNKNAYTEVEVEELRLAFEDITGEDLHWFFDQWYLESGHPTISFQHEYVVGLNQLAITIEQVQEGMGYPNVFIFPVEIAMINEDGTTRIEKVWVDERTKTVVFNDVRAAPSQVIFDPKKTLLFEFGASDPTDGGSQTPTLAMQRYKANLSFRSRMEAISFLEPIDPATLSTVRLDGTAQALAASALKDPYHAIREQAIRCLGPLNETTEPLLSNMADKDPHSSVRMAAIERLSYTEDKKYIPILLDKIKNDPARSVRFSALASLMTLDSVAAMKGAEALEVNADATTILNLADLYASRKMVNKLPFFAKNMDKITSFDNIGFIVNYAIIADKADEEAKGRAARTIIPMLTSPDKTKRVAGFAGLTYLSESIGDTNLSSQIMEALKYIQENETDEEVKEIYPQVGMMMLMMRMEAESKE